MSDFLIMQEDGDEAEELSDLKCEKNVATFKLIGVNKLPVFLL